MSPKMLHCAPSTRWLAVLEYSLWMLFNCTVYVCVAII